MGYTTDVEQVRCANCGGRVHRPGFEGCPEFVEPNRQSNPHEAIFDALADVRESTVTTRRCYCESDCNCRRENRLASCGCQCQDTSKVFRGGKWVKA